MKILNLHIHSLNYRAYQISKYNNNLQNKNSGSIDKVGIIEGNYLYTFECGYCKEFNEDYHTPFGQRFFFASGPLYSEAKYNLNLKTIEFPEIQGTFLIGTKNEIISFVCKKFNELNKLYYSSQKQISALDSTIKTKDKSIKKVQDDLKNEIKEKKNIKSELLTIQSEKKDLSDNLEKEKQISSKLNDEITKLEKEPEKLTLENNNTIKKLENEKQSKKDLEL